MGYFQTYLAYAAPAPDKNTQNPWSAEQSTGNVKGEHWKSEFPRTAGLSGGGADVDTEVQGGSSQKESTDLSSGLSGVQATFLGGARVLENQQTVPIPEEDQRVVVPSPAECSQLNQMLRQSHRGQ